MIAPALYSSARPDWGTPPEVFARLDREFHFDLDAAASRVNAKCSRYFTEAQDGLHQRWTGRVWLNPPYGRGIGAWTAKCVLESRLGAQAVVALLPARTDTAWWERDVMGAATEVRLVRGRIRFVGAATGAPFPSAIVVWTGTQYVGGPRFSLWLQDREADHG